MRGQVLLQHGGDALPRRVAGVGDHGEFHRVTLAIAQRLAPG